MNDELIKKVLDIIDKHFDSIPMEQTTEILSVRREIRNLSCANIPTQMSGISEELPSVQPEIIRCGECKWFQCNMRMDGYLPKGIDEFECRHWCGYCDPVDFCSHAERRTDG